MKFKAIGRVIDPDWRRFKDIAERCTNHASLLDNDPCYNWHHCWRTYSWYLSEQTLASMARHPLGRRRACHCDHKCGNFSQKLVARGKKSHLIFCYLVFGSAVRTCVTDHQQLLEHFLIANTGLCIAS